jgi:hypothetical protein
MTLAELGKIFPPSAERALGTCPEPDESKETDSY